MEDVEDSGVKHGNCLCTHPARDHEPRCVSCACWSFMSVEEFEGMQ